MSTAPPVITVPVAPVNAAETQTTAVILPQAEAVVTTKSQHLEPPIESFECSCCGDLLPIMAYGTHRDGRRHVWCLACNVSTPYNQ
jgi:hypothetical protein